MIAALDPLDDSRRHLCNLLGYAEEILKAGGRVMSNLATDAIAVHHQHDVAGLDGVSAPGGDGCWLRVERLHEIAAPEPDAAYGSWVVRNPGAAAFDRPRLSETCLLLATPEEASDLVEAGLAADEDIMVPKGERAGQGGAVDVLLRLSAMPEFAAAFAAWVAGPWAAWEAAERPRRRSIAFYNRLFEFQQRAVSMGDDVAAEAVFGVGVARWDHPAGKVNAPLIEAAVELDLDPNVGAILVRPRLQAPRLALGAFEKIEVDGASRLQREASEELERRYRDVDVGFSPHEPASFEPVLRMCHARLAPDAVYEPDAIAEDRPLPDGAAKLRVSVAGCSTSANAQLTSAATTSGGL